MKGIAARFGWFGAGLCCLVTVGWVLASPGKPVLEGLPMDWTHRHVIFSQPATAEQARLLANEPRFWQQEYRRQALRVVSNGMAVAEEANSLALAFKGVSTANVHQDWSQDIGSGASTGAGNYPAKYGFQVTAANCVSSGHPDFVVFGTGVSGGTTQASIVAYDNLYSACTGTVPQIFWAYNLNYGFVPTSPVFSQEGTQLAFTGTDGITGKLVLLTWRQQRFVDIWRHSERMNEVRSIRVKDLTTCTQCTHVGSCTRCPGLAFMEGNMRGPSSQDCEKSFARTGIPSANMVAKKRAVPNLIQIRAVQIQRVPAQPLAAMAGATA